MKLFKHIYLAFLFLLTSVNVLNAQTPYVVGSEGVDVDASITEDTNSTVQVSPSNVEIMETAMVTVTILDSNSDPVEGHYIQLEAPGLVFTQPSQASNDKGKIVIQVYAVNPGTYSIQAWDITYGDLVIDILDTASLYVTPVETPTLLEEPEYTQGTTNSLFWNSIGFGYKYNIQVSESSTFNSIKASSGWVTGTMYEFSNLENEIMYFYRVKARNGYGGESGWSNIRYSVQDSEDPVITLISISDIGGNNNVEWSSTYEIEIIYKVEDNLSLESTEFLCVKEDQSKYNCGSTTENGVVYTTTITLNELERDGINDLFLLYTFCIDAADSAGNDSQNCDIKLQIPEWEGEEEEEKPKEVPTSVGRIIRDFFNDAVTAMDNIFGNLNDYELQNIGTTTAIATMTVGIGSLVGGLFNVPIYLFQLFLNLLSLIGMRKKGQLSGYVYDSSTKEPISHAVVRVYSVEGKRLVWTDVTDSRGFFKLGLDNGDFTIKVSAGGYKFPSKIIFGKSDYPLKNVYHGEEFSVIERVIPEFSIPMDEIEMSRFSRIVALIRNRLRIVYKILSPMLFVFGLLFSIYAYSINPTWFNFIIILLYIPSFALVVTTVFKKNLKYGVVKNEKGDVLGDVAVGLKDMEYKKIVSKRSTDGEGKYRFIVNNGKYVLEVLDTEYEVVKIEEEKPRKLSDGLILIAKDIVLRPIKVEK